MTAPTRDNGRYTIISADCHAGADLYDYRPYLESTYHEEFDEWAAQFVNPFADLTAPEADRNWDNDRRLRELESDGVAAEVLYPNTIPPFFPSASLVAPPPSKEDFDKRWAGIRAHNRWLADFCAQAPGRRAGIAQILLGDTDAAVAEIRWAKEAGLTGGILLPGVPPGAGVAPLYSAEHEPIWQACEELGVVLNHHAGGAGPELHPDPESLAMFLLETRWFAHRALWHMIFSGVFERHPNLSMVLTEQGASWLPRTLAHLDHYYHRFRTAEGSAEARFGGPLAERLSMPPSEYWARNCYVGASFMLADETELRHQIGVDRIMWGVDYPHEEGTYPYSRQALRRAFAGIDPAELDAMLGGNAARVYGLDRDRLDAVADRIGPTVDEVAQPLDEPMPADATSPVFSGSDMRAW